MHKKLLDAYQKILVIAGKFGLTLTSDKEIPYGVKLEFMDSSSSSSMNIYYSSKKDKISFTVSKKKSNVSDILQQVVAKYSGDIFSTEEHNLHNWTHWIGSDESGKGDFFGPLVATAFYCKSGDINKLRELGVRDSKELKDQQINIIARKVMKLFPGQYKQIVLTPKKYNELYNNFKKSKKNLNHLLAWMHSKVIADLAKSFNPEGILVDKFANPSLVNYYLANEKVEYFDVIHVTKGERDVAVAAASILARYKFNMGMEYYSDQYGMKIPKGGGNNTLTQGKIFIEKHGQAKLEDVCKMHFVNYKKITNS
jgi:ribonuclease HIII